MINKDPIPHQPYCYITLPDTTGVHIFTKY